MNTHECCMKRAIELAKLGWGRTNPNPLVGAVIVKDGEIIAEGYHEALGCPHAEISALNSSRHEVKGSTLYVNLEPCSHYGRTPPCVNAIIESGISEVVIAMTDPNPKVAGRGIQTLKEAGIRVIEGVLEEEAKKLNEIFIKYMTQKKPFVIMKAAMTIDGKIASVKGDSKWISGESSRKYVHVIRDRVAAVMVGINTVLVDDPLLTTRLDNCSGKDCVRIVVDSKGQLPLDSNILNVELSSGVVLATTSSIDKSKEKTLFDKGVRIIKAEGCDGRVNLSRLMDELYKLEIDSILLEGGGSLNASALKEQIGDKIMFFIAPKIIGGKDAITPVEGEGSSFIKDALKLHNISVTKFDEDILYEGYINFK